VSNERRLCLSLGIALAVMAAEALGGYLSGSLALLSDAGHMLTDAFALGLSLLALRIALRPPHGRATFGYQRVGLLVAVVNGLGLLAIALFIFREAYQRLQSPPEIQTALMLSVASAGLVANLAMAFILGRGHEDLNIRSAWLHVFGDTLSSLGVVVSALVIAATGWRSIDPLMSFLIGAIILVGGLRVVAEALEIFLQLTPRGIDPEELARTLCQIPGVQGVHDLHVWAHTRGRVFFSAHVWVADQSLSALEALRARIKERLRKMGIEHATLEFECAECATEGLYCQLEPYPQEGPEHHRH
jgi:cobalt-zinc-cadmium efflux system protein